MLLTSWVASLAIEEWLFAGMQQAADLSLPMRRFNDSHACTKHPGSVTKETSQIYVRGLSCRNPGAKTKNCIDSSTACSVTASSAFLVAGQQRASCNWLFATLRKALKSGGRGGEG